MTLDKQNLADEMRACPFCGIDEGFCHSTMSGPMSVICQECGCEGPVKDTEAEAIVAWNTRSTERDGWQAGIEAAAKVADSYAAISSIAETITEKVRALSPAAPVTDDAVDPDAPSIVKTAYHEGVSDGWAAFMLHYPEAEIKHAGDANAMWAESMTRLAIFEGRIALNAATPPIAEVSEQP